MRILYLHQFFTTPRGTSGTRSYTFARRFLARGHAVTMVTAGVDGRKSTARRTVENIDGIDVHELTLPYRQEMSFARRKGLYAQFAARATWESLRLPPPDVVFATSTPLTIAVPALLTSRVHRCPMVFEIRDLWPDAPIEMGALSPSQAKAARALERAAYRGASGLVALSPGMEQAARARGAPPGDRTIMVPNGVDPALFSAVPSREEARARFGVPSDRFVAVYVGALGPAHGATVMTDAVAEAARRGIEGLQLVVFGEGSHGDTFRETAARHGSLLDYRGALPRGDVPAALAMADVALVTVGAAPSLLTTCSNKLFDAFGAGRAVIANIDGWNGEIVRRFDCGWVCAPDSGVALLDALVAARADRAALLAKEAGARRAAAEFDRDVFADRVLDLMLRCVAGPAPR